MAHYGELYLLTEQMAVFPDTSKGTIYLGGHSIEEKPDMKLTKKKKR